MHAEGGEVVVLLVAQIGDGVAADAVRVVDVARRFDGFAAVSVNGLAVEVVAGDRNDVFAVIGALGQIDFFALQLARYLSRFARVAYNTLEQGLSLSFQSAWIRAGMEEAGSAIVVLDKEPLPQLRQRLAKRRSPQVVIIDSLTALPGFTRKDYLSLVGGFPGKLFVFLAHERKGLPDPAIAETVRRLSEVKIYVEGFRAHISSRYACPERGEGVSDYIIWRQGADEYHLQNI